MLRDLIENILQRIFRRNETTEIQPLQPTDIVQGEIQPNQDRPRRAREPSIHELFQNMIRNEAMESQQSETIESGFIAELDSEFPVEIERREITEGGIRTTRSEAFLLTQAGNIIRKEDLRGGGTCCECEAIVDKNHIYECAYCLEPICPLCMRTLSNRFYCVTHYRLFLPHWDAWQDLD